MVMKAITVWQPWASLIALGFKPYEFRAWPAPRQFWGERIAIHAGGRLAKPAEIRDLITRLRGPTSWTTRLKPEALAQLESWHLTPGSLLRSHVLCTAILGEPKRSHEIVGEFGGVINDSDRDEHSMWAWPLSDIQQLEPPQPANGLQGFWNWRGNP